MPSFMQRLQENYGVILQWTLNLSNSRQINFIGQSNQAFEEYYTKLKKLWDELSFYFFLILMSICSYEETRRFICN